ncbi:post-GPI attachment to proteins factor 2-like [Montipora capricornis]|uniref:post-GPI attachment to proteins factor 2-like n=1 Tax=Montipora capricornis TaxID=246305 RepID=UPI0035F117E1
MASNNPLPSPVLSVSFDAFAIWICSLPLVSFVACVVISVLWHFEETTRTHCKVNNYLPSISASVGGFMPERFIWRVGIALHCLPRIAIVPYSLHKYFKAAADKKYNLKTWWFWLLNLSASLLHLLENGALITLTYISSNDNRDVHEASFIGFMVCSMVFMLLWCVLFKLTASQPMTNEEYTLFRRNLCTMTFNCCSFGMAVYFFFRHNWYCEPGIYTFFALCEYFTILSNIAFHWHCTWLFNGAYFRFGYFGDESAKTM